MEWIKSLKQFFKTSGAVIEPDVNKSIVIFSGLFSYTKKEKCIIQNRYNHHKVEFGYPDIIRNQYYPVFRKFILNDCSYDYLQLKNGNSYSLRIGDNQITVEDARLSFFDDEIGLGIYSFKVNLEAYTSFCELIKIIRELRSFRTEVSTGNKTESILEFIQHNILRCEDNPSTKIKLKIDKTSNVYNYSGDKLKTFVAIEVDKKFDKGYSIEEALYELGTLTDFSTSKITVGASSPASTYFDSIVSKRIAVFRNWSGLALFDSFVLIGEKDYLKGDDTVSMISESYFKIFLFNMYVKFYLFKVNSDLEDKRSTFSKKQLYSFLQKYDLKHISYNFLPNLIHDKIREAMEIDLELSAVRSKIEMLDSLRQEQYSKKINVLLLSISLLTIVSFLNDLPNVVCALLGTTPENLTYWAIGFILVVFIIVYLVNFRRKG